MSETAQQSSAAAAASKRNLDAEENFKEMTKEKWDWEPDTNMNYPLMPKSSLKLNSDSNASIVQQTSVNPGWRLRDILLAAKLLTKSTGQRYSDEAEMRRVFGLVYDVLRYKQILDNSLDDVGFWRRRSDLKDREKVVHLLLYDLQGRKFSKPTGNNAVTLRDEALKEAGLLEIERALLAMKTRLAASLSRLRIGGSALSLDELLPAHLRTAEGVTWGEDGAIASGWINSSKIVSRERFIGEMFKLGLTLCQNCSPNGTSSKSNELREYQYVFDPMCPKVVSLHEKSRERLAVSWLVRNHAFIFLDRSLCLGAAALVQSIRIGKLCGPVILTHSLAPRHTGYLIELLSDFEDVKKLLVFGLGDAFDRHLSYLKNLGATDENCQLFAEKYTTAAPTTDSERATIVLATPPCSFTGVKDVVDLAIARGGDLKLLESLTNVDAEIAKQPQVHLNEQMSTLKHALTRPNVQLLVYEVHTLLPSETHQMIEQALEHANKLARDKFKKEHQQKKKKSRDSRKQKSSKRVLAATQSTENVKNVQSDQDASKVVDSDEETAAVQHSDSSASNQPIPESDLFVMTDVSELYKQDCSRMIDSGSFVKIVKRKEMMQFNSLFMIKVAEAKGVFGDPNRQRQQPNLSPTKTPELAKTPSKGGKSGRSKKNKKLSMERLTAPTQSSLLKVGCCSSNGGSAKAECPRRQQHLEHEETEMQRQKSSNSEILQSDDVHLHLSNFSSSTIFQENKSKAHSRNKPRLTDLMKNLNLRNEDEASNAKEDFSRSSTMTRPASSGYMQYLKSNYTNDFKNRTSDLRLISIGEKNQGNYKGDVFSDVKSFKPMKLNPRPMALRRKSLKQRATFLNSLEPVVE